MSSSIANANDAIRARFNAQAEALMPTVKRFGRNRAPAASFNDPWIALDIVYGDSPQINVNPVIFRRQGIAYIQCFVPTNSGDGALSDMIDNAITIFEGQELITATSQRVIFRGAEPQPVPATTKFYQENVAFEFHFDDIPEPVAAPAFDPAAASGMQLWAQTDLSTTSGGVVTAWPNQVSGGWEDLVPVGSPTVVSSLFASGKDGFRCLSGQRFTFGGPTHDLSGTYSLFFAIQTQSSQGTILLGDTTGNDGWGIGSQVSGNLICRSSIITTTFVVNGFQAGQALTYCEIYHVAGVTTVYKNGVEQTVDADASGVVTVSRIGDGSMPFSPGDTQIGIIGIATADLSAQHADFDSYLSSWSGI